MSPFKTKRRFVFVDDEQVPVSPREVADRVSGIGFREAAAHYGVSESLLRTFLAQNGLRVVGVRRYQVVSNEMPTPEGVTTDGSKDATARGGDTLHPTGA